MSQFYVNISDSNIPPDILTSVTTDVKDNTILGPGVAKPSSNNLFILGRDSSQNNVNGIRTDADPNNDDHLYVELTNRLHGSTTTSDGAGQSKTFMNFDLGSTPGTYIFDVNIAAFNVTDSLSATYKVSVSRRTTGVAASGVGTDTFTEKEEGIMVGVIVTVQTVGNILQIAVTGLAGKTIDWVAVASYIFAS